MSLLDRSPRRYEISKIPDFADIIALEYQKQRDDESKRVAIWRRFDRSLIPYERAMASKLRGFFMQQKKEVLSNMEAKSKGISDWMFDVVKYELLFEEFGQLLLPEVVQDRGDEELQRLAVGVSFNVSDPRVTEFLADKIFKFSFKPNETTKNHLRREFAEGLAEGEGIPQLAKRVKKVFGFAEKYRSVRIARTEILGSSNFGAVESYKQSGVVEKKEWLATKDNRVRDSHKPPLDGEVVLLDATFSNGLMYPGDPSGPPEEIIQCRCTTVPIVKEQT